MTFCILKIVIRNSKSKVENEIYSKGNNNNELIDLKKTNEIGKYELMNTRKHSIEYVAF